MRPISCLRVDQNRIGVSGQIRIGGYIADLCMIDIGGKDVLSIDGSQVAEEIARSLEKKGILKMKGNMIKWKA